MKAARWVVIVALVVGTIAGPARADGSNEQVFREGVTALDKGDHGRAIALFESLADRGFVHPDVSYDRGLAYLARVRAKAEQPGDLGRAIAAFEEALLARPGDADAERAVEIVRAEIARRHASRAGHAEVETRPSLDRIIVGLAPEAVWAWCALVASLVLTLGLALRKVRAGPARLAGIIATPIGVVGLLVFTPLAARARHLRETTHPAVVVATEARIVDENGGALPSADPIVEGTRVDVRKRHGELAYVRTGTTEAWTRAASLRELAVER
jgi:hypothetical protein